MPDSRITRLDGLTALLHLMKKNLDFCCSGNRISHVIELTFSRNSETLLARDFFGLKFESRRWAVNFGFLKASDDYQETRDPL